MKRSEVKLKEVEDYDELNSNKFSYCSSPEVAKVLVLVAAPVTIMQRKNIIVCLNRRIEKSLKTLCVLSWCVWEKSNKWKSGDIKFYIQGLNKAFLERGNFYISLNTTLLYVCMWLIILIQGFKLSE